MKADRFNNLQIASISDEYGRKEAIVTSDTDRWSVMFSDNQWSVQHRGRAYKNVTSTPQGQKILSFVQSQAI